MANGQDSLRDRLIQAGIEEISAHGIAAFSLRRVANACSVSCAAPYRHFKNKEEFVCATVEYINSQWGLLRNNILHLFEHEPHRLFIELSVAYIRFLLANDNYRSVLLASGHGFEEDELFSHLLSACVAGDEKEKKRRLYATQALLYGTVSMLESGELPNEEATFDMVKKTLSFLVLA